MEISALWALFAAVIGAAATGIGILLHLGAARKERSEAIYEKLLSEFHDVVREIGNWDGKKKLSIDRKRVISRMLHVHLDSLVESIAIEGGSWWRGFLYRLGIGKLLYKSIEDKWFLEKHRYQRFESWYSGTLVLYNSILGVSSHITHPDPNYIEEVFHPRTIERDLHHGNESLKQYFEKRLNFEQREAKDMDEKLMIAGVQMEPRFLHKERNLEKCLELIQLTAMKNARLIVFPECALTGYMFSSRDEALPVCESIPGPSTERIIDVCRDLNVYVVIGLLESVTNDECYNAAVLLGPEGDGLIGKHRKLHRPFLGIDRFLEDGNLPLTVYDTEIGRIGMGICYDMMFAEYSRVLALKGADILIFPANWPETGRVYTDYIVPTRAIENHVFCVAVNRVGKERGTTFFGGSVIAHFDLDKEVVLTKGKPREDDIIYAKIEPTEARRKHLVIVPEEHEVDFIEDRKPQFYGDICQV